jgi:hypothetical protein
MIGPSDAASGSRRLLRTGAIALIALGLFSLIFSLLAERGLWPRLRAGALHDTDLVAGFAAVVGWVILLARRRPRSENGGSPHPVGADPANADRAPIHPSE